MLLIAAITIGSARRHDVATTSTAYCHSISDAFNWAIGGVLTLVWHAKGIGHALDNRNMPRYTLPLYRSLCSISFAEINANRCRAVPSRHPLYNARPCVCWSLKFFSALWKKEKKKHCCSCSMAKAVPRWHWPRQHWLCQLCCANLMLVCVRWWCYLLLPTFDKCTSLIRAVAVAAFPWRRNVETRVLCDVSPC